MEKFITISVLFSTLSNLAVLSNGLKCYTCAHTERGEIVGYDQDDSCQWGSKPDEKYLKDCATEDDNQGKNKFEFICAELRLSGTYEPTDPEEPPLPFTGTLRGCAARMLPPAASLTQPKQNTTMKGVNQGIRLIKECKQGELKNVINEFQNQVGKEYLESMNAIFEDESEVKFCARDCETTGCWSTDDDLPKNSAGNDRSGSLIFSFIFSFFITFVSFLG